jgi:hypothetical protein
MGFMLGWILNVDARRMVRRFGFACAISAAPLTVLVSAAWAQQNDRTAIFADLAVPILAGLLLVAGWTILWFSVRPTGKATAGANSETVESENPLRPFALQILGLTFLLPVILVTSVALQLKSEAVTALLGAIVGYIFGSSGVARSSTDNMTALLAALRASTSNVPADQKPGTPASPGAGAQ